MTERLPSHRADYFRIIALVAAALGGYAILQDQVTARLSPEYFTVGHTGMVRDLLTGTLGIQSPTLLGICWGGLAGGLPGLILGMAVAGLCVDGGELIVPPRALLLPVAAFILIVAMASLGMGLTAWALHARGELELGPGWRSVIAPDQHLGFLINLWTHQGTYAGGFVGGTGLVIWSVRERHRRGGKIAFRWV